MLVVLLKYTSIVYTMQMQIYQSSINLLFRLIEKEEPRIGELEQIWESQLINVLICLVVWYDMLCDDSAWLGVWLFILGDK